MPRSATVKFGLADLMILISATAFGLGVYVLIDNNVFRGQRYFFGLFRPAPAAWNSALVVDRAAGLLSSLLPLFGVWSTAIPILGMRRPRPTRRRWGRRPGMTACVAALTGMALAVGVAGLSFLIRWAVDGSMKTPANFWQRGVLFDDSIVFAGVSVAATWASLLATGRWRPTPDALDRLGRSLGVLWLAAGIVFATRQFLQ